MILRIYILAIVFAVLGCNDILGQTTLANDPAGQKAALAAKTKFVEQQNVTLDQANRLFAEKAYGPAFDLYSKIIKAYLDVIPDHPGIAGIVVNSSLSLRLSMIQRYNQAIAAGPAAAKDPAVAKSRNEILVLAKDGFKRSDDLAKTAVAMAFEFDISPIYSNADTKERYLTALQNRVEAIALVAQYVDLAVSDDTHQIFLQYLSVEKDPVKKQKAWLKLAKLYFDTTDVVKSNFIYATVLKDSPDNTEALFYNAMGLITLGEKAGLTVANKQLTRFLEITPANDPKRKDAAEALEYLKQTDASVPK